MFLTQQNEFSGRTLLLPKRVGGISCKNNKYRIFCGCWTEIEKFKAEGVVLFLLLLLLMVKWSFRRRG